MVAIAPTLLDRVFHLLAGFPRPEEVLQLRLTDEESARISELTERNLAQHLTTEERLELDQYFQAEKYVRLAKAKAVLLLERGVDN